MVMIASFKTAKLRQRLQETHVNYTGSHITLYTVFVREFEYAQFDTLSLFYVLLIICIAYYVYLYSNGCWDEL